MTGKFIRIKDNTTLKLEFEDLSPMPEDTVKAAAHELWDRAGLGDHGDTEDLILFEALDEQDHIDILFNYAKRVILDLAGAYVYNVK